MKIFANYLLIIAISSVSTKYVSKIKVDSKSVVEIKISENDFDEKNLPTRFKFEYNKHKLIFYQRIFDQKRKVYSINRKFLKDKSGQYVSFTKKSLINIINNQNKKNGKSFKIIGFINLEKNKILKINSTFKYIKEKRPQSVNNTENSNKYPKRRAFKFGRTCGLGVTSRSCDICGLHKFQPNVRIVGGVNAVQKSWPSVGLLSAIFIYQSEKYEMICSLALIERNTALTAAHCKIDGISLSAYKVILGLYKLNELDIGLSSYVQAIYLKDFIKHEKYDLITSFNDIAILKFKTEAVFNDFVQPACLPLYEFYAPVKDSPSWIVGYGNTKENGTLPEYLQNAVVNYYTSPDKCANYESFNFQTEICAGDYFKGGVDTCQGDSGGPLYTKSYGVYVLTGLTSRGLGCARPYFPGIYTKVSAHLAWILKNIEIKNIY